MSSLSKTTKRLSTKAAIAVGTPLHKLRNHLPHDVFILILAILVGALAGTGAFLLKTMIAGITHLVSKGIVIDSGARYLILPVIGIVIAAVYQRYVIHRNLEHGTEKIKKQLENDEYSVPTSLIYNPLIASSVTLGFGGSAGSEGPIATAGAAIGSNLAKAARLDAQTMRLMVAIGAGAGIAGIFKSSVGGAMFTLEVLGLGLGNIGLLALFSACIVAALTAYLWSGCTPDVSFTPVENFDPAILPGALVLGLFCGLYGAYYSYTGHCTRRFLDGISNNWVKNLFSGLALGLMLFMFPALYGEGYGVLGTLINAGEAHIAQGTVFYEATAHVWGLFAVIAGILLCKGVATILTNSGGGVAGEFAPTLFAGGVAGFFFATVSNHLFGTDMCTQTFALLGMAGAMSAIIRAPLMAIFITAEMTWNYEFFLPITLTAVIAYFTARIVLPKK